MNQLTYDIHRLIALYLDNHDIHCFYHLNRKICYAIHKNHIFLRQLAHQRLTLDETRLSDINILKEIRQLKFDDCLKKGYEKSLKYFDCYIDTRNLSSLRIAVIRGMIDVVQELLTIARTHEKLKRNISSWTTDMFIYASSSGHLALVKYLLESSDRSYTIDIHEHYEHAFRMASQNGHIDIIEYLLDRNNDIDVQALDNYALKGAAGNGHLAVVDYLINNGADIHVYNDYPLRLACLHDHLAVIQYLVINGADVNAEDSNALMFAIKKGHLKIIEYLVSAGINIHAQNNEAIIIAIKHGHLAILKHLIDNKLLTQADFDSRSEDIFMSAVMNSRSNIMEYLSSVGYQNNSWNNFMSLIDKVRNHKSQEK